MKRAQLLNDDDVERMAAQEATNWDPLHREDAENGASEVIEKVRALYEAERARDAALIETLVDALHAVASLADVDADERSVVARPGLAAAKAAGFIP